MNRMPHRVVLAVGLLLGVLGCDAPPEPTRLHPDTVNLVLGDESYERRFGHPVPAGEDDTRRVRIHLEYVLERLRQRPPEGMSLARREARIRTLAHLEDYIRRGRFPHNHEFPAGRRPTFIDAHGSLCAVAHLFARDEGRSAAEDIAAEYRSAFLRDMHSPRLTRWASRSGLELEDLEMIQPEYQWLESEIEPGPLYTSLDRVDALTRVSLETGVLFERERDGVPLRLLAAFGFTSKSLKGLGLYGALALTKLTGADTSASALSNTDLGISYGRSLPWIGGWWVFRTGLLLPSGDEDAVGAALNQSVAPQRLADAVLFQPGALGGRLGLAWNQSFSAGGYNLLSLRLETGLDAYGPHDNPWQWSPRWGVGLGYRFGSHWVMTLEGSGARHPRHPASSGRIHHTLAGSLRYLDIINPRRMRFAPGLTVTVPLRDEPQRVFVGLDLSWRFGDGDT